MAIRVLITDDHGVVRQGLRMFLSLDPELEVVGEAANGQEAVAMARELEPDVVLMDLLMPVMDGIGATEAIRAELPEVEVIALTSVLEDASVTGAVRAAPETEVLKLLARGKANKQIAGSLYLSEKTVKAHVSSILMKLGVQSRTQAALHAVRTGLVSTEELSDEPW
jgi:NarL family two-component system response regulator LiaR